MDSQIALYYEKGDGLYFHYIADWLEGVSQGLNEGPSPESLNLQLVVGKGTFFIVFHQTKGLMRQTIRSAVAQFFCRRDGPNFHIVEREFFPYLKSMLMEDLQYPEPVIGHPLNLCLIATESDGIFQVRSDGSVVIFHDLYFSDPALELYCHPLGTELSLAQITKGMMEAASLFVGGTQMHRMTISGKVGSTNFEITNFRGDSWGHLHLVTDERGNSIVCDYH